MENEIFNPFEVKEDTFKLSLTAPKIDSDTCEVVLLAGLAKDTLFKGKSIVDGDFETLNNKGVATAKVIEGVSIAHQTAFDLANEYFVKELRVKIKPAMNSFSQVEAKAKILRFDRKGEISTNDIQGYFDNKSRLVVYPINQVVGKNNALVLEMVSSISVEVDIVY